MSAVNATQYYVRSATLHVGSAAQFSSPLTQHLPLSEYSTSEGCFPTQYIDVSPNSQMDPVSYAGFYRANFHLRL